MKNSFLRMTKTLPSLYHAETNVMIGGLLKAWGLSDDQISIQLDNTKAQLFVNTAESKNLDNLASNVGVKRAPQLGISDSDFQKLVPTLSFFPKQVRATIISLLDVFWGQGFTRANLSSTNPGPFNFGPEITLTGNSTFTLNSNVVTGSGTLFTAELQVGSYITVFTSAGTTYQKVSAIIDDSTVELSLPWAQQTAVNIAAKTAPIRNLNYSVDGKAQKSIRLIPNAFVNVNAATVDELVSFINSSQEHSSVISASAFIDPINGTKLNLRTNTPGLLGSIQILGGDANTALRLNFDGSLHNQTRCKVLEINPNEIVIQIPSSVPVLRRNLKGSAHFKETKARISSSKETFNFAGLGATSTLTLTIDATPYTVTFTHSLNFADPTKATSEEVTDVINSQLLFLKAKTSVTSANEHAVTLETTDGAAQYQITGGTANTLLNFPTALQKDPDLIVVGYPSSYIYNPAGQLFSVTKVSSTLSTALVAGTVSSTMNLTDASQFPNKAGKFILDFGRNIQEGPIAYNSRPNNSTLLIDASHQFQKDHAIGRSVNLISASPSIPRVTGEDYPVFVTGTEEARIAAQSLIQSLLAAGVVIRFIIDFPEFQFMCTCATCGPSESPTQRGSLTASGPLTF